MSLTIGIVGLPNVGKSTVFNALTHAQNAEVANYPFCTITPNHAVVPVPDARLDTLHDLAGVPNKIYATVEFVDIAGLVRGASRGEGLGNQFLGNIRDAEALVHVVRCFADANVVHISPRPDPRLDTEIVATELMLADLQQLEKKIERLEGQVKGDRKQYGPQMELALALQEQLGAGVPASAYPGREEELFRAFNQEMRFLSGKPLIYVANVDEAGLAAPNDCLRELRAVAEEQEAQVITICARLEEDLIGLSADEQAEYLALSGIDESGLAQLIRSSYELLGLISFFTMNQKEVRAWTVREGSTAPQAAGVIHTDFERGFIRAEVMSFATFAQYGSSGAARAAGALRIEGKEYVVQDGDVILFRFNV